jgi:hypothetical protein
MLSHFNELLVTTASDGASAATDVCTKSNAADLNLLMDAWYQERQDRIEVGLLLDEAKRLLFQIVRDGEVTPSRQRKARRLLQVIKKAKKAQRQGEL